MGIKTMPEATEETLENIYMYHSPTDLQQNLYENLRLYGKKLAEVILELCPDCRERKIALMKVEEAVMWANASIARSGGE
jgi:hypothetical protein